MEKSIICTKLHQTSNLPCCSVYRQKERVPLECRQEAFKTHVSVRVMLVIEDPTVTVKWRLAILSKFHLLLICIGM